jgi:hypothetical protein
MDISLIDKNLKIETKINKSDIVFFDIKNEPFSVHGGFYENGEWVRMPDSVAKTVSEGVHSLSKHTAGIRVRFVTDSPYVAIHTKQEGTANMCHMPPSGQCGFDLYEYVDGKEVYVKSFIPPFTMTGGYDSVIDFPTSGEHTVTVNFPLYFNVRELYIGLREGAVLKKAPDYTVKKPVVFYGSSITQGGCASRPGNSYQGFLSRRYGFDYINLGFSGSARGEDSMADYIASLDMSAFIYDYDYNAPTAEHLKMTHERFYKKIRKAHPDIPIVFMSRPKIYLDSEEAVRKKTVRQSYEAALARGECVYLALGDELIALSGNDANVDGCHPNDLGFFSMAKRLEAEFDKFIEGLK